MIASIVQTCCLAIVAAAALLHLNATRDTAWCERLGFALTAGGAFGVMAETWWLQAEYVASFILHTGLALVALSLVRGDLRALFGGAWNGSDRRRRRLSATEFLDRRFREPR